MNHGMKLILLSAALLLAGTAQATNRALLVGVGKYQQPGNDLDGIEIDISTMQGLASLLGFTHIEVLQDQQATYANVSAALQRLVGDLGPDDRALFYFSGHGAQFKDNNGDEADDGKDEALVLYDADVNQARNVLLDDEIGGLLSQMKNGQLLMLVDACHSGTVDKSTSSKGLVSVEASAYAPATTAQVKGRGYFPVQVKATAPVARDPAGNIRYVALNAAQGNQFSLASPNGSYFTLGLAEALKTAQPQGGITLKELREKTDEFIAKNIEPKKRHNPQLQGNPELFDKPIQVVSTSQHPNGEMWAMLEELVEQDSGSGMAISTDLGERIKINQFYTLDVRMPKDFAGYLSVVAVDSGREEITVLFPNDWAMSEAQYKPGDVVKLPPPDTKNWGLQALPPASKTLIVALATDQPLKLYEKGIRESRINPQSKDFARLAASGRWALEKSVRSTAAVARSAPAARTATAKVIVDFHE